MARTMRFSILGITFPVHRWTVWFFSVVAVLTAGMFSYRHFYPEDLISLKEAKHALEMEIQEYGRHMMDVPKQSFDEDGLRIRLFDDRCLMIQRKSLRGGVQTKLLPDMERSDLQHTEGDGIQPKTISQLEQLGFVATVLAAEALPRCLNPHPGQFATVYGRRDGCWLEVWRSWPDGCVHVQMLNTCTGWWDSWQDGSPKVTWTRCVH